MTQALLHLGFVVAVLVAGTRQLYAVAEHSQLARSRSAALTELGRTLFFDVRFSGSR
jgi:cytochrome c peroxidase